MRGALLVLLVGCQFGTSGGSRTIGPGDGRASGEGQRDEITMIDVNGQRVDDAKAKLRAAGVTGEISVQGNGPTICGMTPGPGNKTLGHLSVSLTTCADEARETAAYKAKMAVPEVRGLTVEEATKVIRANGFTDKIEVMTLSDFDADCKANTVCRPEPEDWLPRHGYHERHMSLMVNRKADIALPPSD